MSSFMKSIGGLFGFKGSRSGNEENPAHTVEKCNGLLPHDNWTNAEGEPDWKDVELLNLSGDRENRVPFTRGMLLTNTHITGKTGSGKSSSILPAIIRKVLEDQWGLYVFVVKAEDIIKWKEMAFQCGRGGDLIIVRPGTPEKEAPWRFNFLEYCSPWGRISSITLVNLFKEVAGAQAAKNFGGGGGDNMDFFQKKFEQLIGACIDVLLIAKGKVSLVEIDEMIKSAPRNEKQAKSQLEYCEKEVKLSILIDKINAKLKTTDDTARVRELKKLLQKTEDEINGLRAFLDKENYILSPCITYCIIAKIVAKTVAQKADSARALDYFLRTFAPESEKQRDGSIGIWDGMASPLLRGEINQIFNTTTNFTPDDAWEKGKIIIMAIPTHEFLEAGVLIQVMWKYIVQRAIEKRTESKQAKFPRPVLLVSDEAQEVFSRNDSKFVRVCRGYRAGMLYLTQSLSNYKEKLGAQSEYVIETLLGSFKHRFWGTSDCPYSNSFAQNAIGKGIQYLFNSSQNTSVSMQHILTPSFSSNRGSGESVIDLIQTSEFVGLSTVCSATNYTAEFIYQRAGEKLPNGKTYMKVAFRGEKIDKKFEGLSWEDEQGESPPPNTPDRGADQTPPSDGIDEIHTSSIGTPLFHSDRN